MGSAGLAGVRQRQSGLGAEKARTSTEDSRTAMARSAADKKGPERCLSPSLQPSREHCPRGLWQAAQDGLLDLGAAADGNYDISARRTMETASTHRRGSSSRAKSCQILPTTEVIRHARFAQFARIRWIQGTLEFS